MYENLSGQTYNRLLVLSYAGRSGQKTRWLCQCDCGATKVLEAYSIKKGLVKSCGCLRREVSKTKSLKHGLSKHPLFHVWWAMQERCYDKTNQDYHRYGQRGITVSRRWRESFQEFYNDMIEGYGPGLTIDRKDNNGPYCKRNCQWSTVKQQVRNREKTLKLTTPWGYISLAEAAEKSGLPYKRVSNRFNAGWTQDEIFKNPLHARAKRKA